MLNYDWIKEKRKEIIIIFVAVLLLFLLQSLSQIKQRNLYIEEGQGVIAIERGDVNSAESIPLVIEVDVEGKTERYDLILTFVERGNDDGDVSETDQTREDAILDGIQQVVNELEDSEENCVVLPTSLEDGTKVNWQKPSMVQNFLLLFLIPLGIFFLYRAEKEQEMKAYIRRQEDIRRALPAFNDQILLLMHSGLIFHDAFFRIAENYGQRKQGNYFFQILLEMAEQVGTTGQSIVSVMEISKQKVSMREYSRMVNILTDNQIKGVDLQGKLESESTLLWEGRKALSLQKGKEMETKLTFPLAVLLMVVVMIAGVPAMLSM